MPNAACSKILILIVAILITAASSRADEPSKKPATNPAAPADGAGPAKFYGTISATDANAKTFTIDGVVYSIVAESHVTKAADDSPATIADAKVGEVARGTYTKTSDGKLAVTKVRFGKKTGGKKAGKSAATKPQQ